MKRNYTITGIGLIAVMMLISARAATPEANDTHPLNTTGHKKDFSTTGEAITNNQCNNPLLIKSHQTLSNGLGKSVISPASPDADAAIGNIIEPNSGAVCSSIVLPKITIQNLGSDVLNSVDVGMILDGTQLGVTTTFSNLSLASSATSGVINLSPGFTASSGVHELKVFTSNPNGNPDASTGNDTVSVFFSLVPELALTYKESFESESFPPDNGSDVINSDPGSLTWEKTFDAGNPGSSSMVLRGFDYDSVGQRDIYRTPTIDVRTLDSVVLFFSVAYKQYDDASSDSLSIVYSPDCGVTWLPTGYSKGGAELSTSAGYAAESFIPGASEWRVERVALKDFCAKGLRSIMIGFQSYNGYGNNIYVDGINIAGFTSPARNAWITAITAPSLALCSTSVSPVINFNNQGLDPLKTLKLNYQIDGGAVVTFDWTGNLARCGSATATLGASTAAEGTHILTVFSSAPNGLNDLSTSNDTLRKTFTIYNTTPAVPPVMEGFETTSVPAWGVENFDGLKTWEKTTAAAKTGTASLWINDPAADNANHAIDNFISPIVDNSIATDSVFISWDYAYKAGATYPGSTVLPLDTLEVLVTQDCGVSFTSVWKKWGEELQTVNEPNFPSATPFVPASGAEWKSARVYISPVIGSANFQVYFSAKSNKQNNIWLDNLNINSKVLPARLKSQGYLIYPNPFNNSFVVHHVTPPVELQAMQVFNSTGQLVWEKHYNGNATTEVNINLGNLAKGVYILKMNYSNKNVVERIVKQ